MSRFFSKKHASLAAYVPGEQPKTGGFIKLNTNESPFPPSENVLRAVEEASRSLQLYSDPTAWGLRGAAAAYYGVDCAQILMTNGSDEILDFAFLAYGDEDHPFVFPDITYGFYPVFAKLHGIPYREIPLKDDFSIDVNDYVGVGANIVIANPNAPTGLLLSNDDIRKIAQSNPDHVVIIDEAYIDFGGESALPLLAVCENLIITRTFSKSYSLAGARLGIGIASKEIIADLYAIKDSTNPYNVNRMTMAAGTAAIGDAEYYKSNCRTVEENRAYTKAALEALGFSLTDSYANFVFASHPKMNAKALYEALKARGILVRHFDKARISDYIRITIGTRAQMEALVAAISELQKEGATT